MHKIHNFVRKFILSSVFLFTSAPVLAQITPDNTMGAEISQIRLSALGDRIEGGAIRGSNLFHSFSEFNINDGQRVYFSNPSGISNILTRVTGGNASSILGTLGVDGGANLFIINPNGIFFGQNARLDVQGSFVGTTANGVQFGNQGVFSATTPQAPSLLTVNPSALLFNQINTSVAPVGVNMSGLRVPDGKSLLLVAGDILVNGGGIFAIEGNIHLASLAAPGDVGLNIAGDNFNLTIPDNIERANLFLNNNAEVNVRGSNNGNIKIDARDISLTQGSKIKAGIETGTPLSQSGNITINATGATTLTDDSFIANILQEKAFGKSGDINITTGTLTLNSGGQIDSSNYGTGNTGNININTGSLSILQGSEIQGSTWSKGNSGNITINAKDNILIDGRNGNLFSRISNSVQAGAEGNAGNIQITINTLNINNGAYISSANLGGKGNVGDITINAGDTISLNQFGYINSDIGRGGVGNGANTFIKTGSLSLSNGSQISSNVSGKGSAGNINIEAQNNVKIEGVLFNVGKFFGIDLDLEFDFPSSITSSLLSSGIGKAGNIQILTPSLLVNNGAQISSTSSGKGNAGNITINASSNVNLTGFEGRNNLNSQVASYVIRGGVGNGGDININAGNLLVKDGGSISAYNSSKGNGGNIYLNVRDTITFDGISGSGLPSNASTLATNGDAGSISLKTGSLFLSNGGYMSSVFVGNKGNAGNIIINARDTVKLDGVVKGIILSNGTTVNANSNLTSALLSGEGRGGNIEITTGSLFVNNGAQISSDTIARGDAGNITINARDIVSFDAGKDNLFTFAGTSTLRNSTGNGGNISLTAGSLFLKNGALLSAISGGKGNAGNIFINTRDVIEFDGSDMKNFTSQATAFATGTGKGGNIEVKTGTLRLTNGGQITTYAKTNAGNIDIYARDAVLALGVDKNNIQSGAFSYLSSEGIGRGGDIQVTTNFLTLSNGGQFRASSFGKGDAGNIFINARDTLSVKGTEYNAVISGVFTTLEEQAQGRGGNIDINTGSLSINGSGQISTSTLATGNAGDITINARETINIDGKGRGNEISGILSSVLTGASGNAGNTNIKAGNIRISNSSGIQATTFAGQGGNVFLDINDFLLLRNGGYISTTAGIQQAGGDGGNITINTPFIVAVPGENSDITANAFTGKGGQIDITTQGIFGIAPRAEATDITNDITASSKLGIQGQVTIAQPDTDPSKGINELPEQVSDISQQIAQTCPRKPEAVAQMGKFTITGRGSLPPSPLHTLDGRSNNLALATLDKTTANYQPSKNVVPSSPIVEAQAWVKDKDGNIVLVTQEPVTALSTSTSCH